MSHETDAAEPRLPDDDEPPVLGMDERAAWVQLVSTAATTLAYAAVVALRARERPVDEIVWVAPMLVAMAANVVGTIVLAILFGVGGALRLHVLGRDPDLECASDVRDREIEKHGGRYASALVSAGLLAVLVLTMLDTHGFFVAQAAFGAGALASMADAAVRIRAYRRGFTP
jgi:hypothetical protein